MAEEHHEKHEEHHHEEHHEEHKKRFHIKLTRQDKIAIVALILFVIIFSIPVYLPKGDCEIARAGYKCDSAKNVMIENCGYWGKFSCDTSKDSSLPQIEWYIGNLCKIQNQYHNTGLDCTNLKAACNQISGQNLC